MKRFALSLLLLLAAAPLQALESPELTGSLRNLTQLIESSPLLNERLVISSNTRRREGKQRFANRIELQAAFENQWLYSSPAGRRWAPG